MHPVAFTLVGLAVELVEDLCEELLHAYLQLPDTLLPDEVGRHLQTDLHQVLIDSGKLAVQRIERLQLRVDRGEAFVDHRAELLQADLAEHPQDTDDSNSNTDKLAEGYADCSC